MTGPFTLHGALVLVAIGVGGAALSLRLLARRKLTIGYAIVWTLAFLGLGLLVAVPSLLLAAGDVLGAVRPEGALRLLAVVTMLGFLLFLSIEVSVLSRRLEDLAQQLALLENALREGRRPPQDRRGSDA